MFLTPSFFKNQLCIQHSLLNEHRNASYCFMEGQHDVGVKSTDSGAEQLGLNPNFVSY